MNVVEPDFNNFEEAVVQLSTYSGDPEEWIIYEQNDEDVYYPSFIRYGEIALDEGKKVQIEVVSNGFIARQGNKTLICDSKWSLETAVRNFTSKIIEKERDLSEDEKEELTTMTLKINTHFAAQSKR